MVRNSPYETYAEDIIAASGFAFRMWVDAGQLCPCATSIWEFKKTTAMVPEQRPVPLLDFDDFYPICEEFTPPNLRFDKSTNYAFSSNSIFRYCLTFFQVSLLFLRLSHANIQKIYNQSQNFIPLMLHSLMHLTHLSSFQQVVDHNL